MTDSTTKNSTILFNSFDYFIIGQGLAGTLLAHQLRSANQKVLLIDRKKAGAASPIAAGIINPITGRRFVKSWMIEKLLPIAKETYQNLSNLLKIPLFSDQSILRALKDVGDENEWTTRCAYPDFAAYVKGLIDPIKFPQGLTPPMQMGELTGGMQVRIPDLIRTYREYALQQHFLLEEAFTHQDLKVTSNEVSYQEYTASKAVFCEGFYIRENPWFGYLPMVLAKGETFVIKAPELQLDKLYKNKLIYAPLGDQHFWAGATYEWNFKDALPSQAGYQQLLKKIKSDLSVDFEVVQHYAAIRPTVDDRRPLLGIHPKHASLAVFNGLGTKGASLGPYWAERMKDHLLFESTLSPEVNINRYLGKWEN